MFFKPKINVLYKPSPKIGKIRLKEKLSKFPKNKNRVLINTSGKIIDEVVNVALKLKLFTKIIAMININIINT